MVRITITQGEKKHLDNTKEAFKFNDKDVSSIIKFTSLIPQLILSYKVYYIIDLSGSLKLVQ